MILQVADFVGRFRLPQGVGPDLQPAVDQAERRLLGMYFGYDTVNFILAAPTQPPATTLRSGVPGLPPFTDLVPAVASRIVFTSVGLGGQPTTTEFRETMTLMQQYEGLVAEYGYYVALKKIRSTVWIGQGTVLSTSPFEVALPPAALVWLRPGASVYIQSVKGEVSAVNPASVELTFTGTPPAVAVGDTVRYSIGYDLNIVQRFEDA